MTAGGRHVQEAAFGISILGGLVQRGGEQLRLGVRVSEQPGTYWAESVSLRTSYARIIEITKRGNFAWVSRESQTPKTSEVGAIFASGSALPLRTALKASCKLLLEHGAAHERVALRDGRRRAG